MSPKMAHFDCHILPLLPPITPNGKLPIPATRLEFGILPRSPSNTTSKSGKNGNVHHPSQLSPPPPPPHSLSSVSHPSLSATSASSAVQSLLSFLCLRVPPCPLWSFSSGGLVRPLWTSRPVVHGLSTSPAQSRG